MKAIKLIPRKSFPRGNQFFSLQSLASWFRNAFPWILVDICTTDMGDTLLSSVGTTFPWSYRPLAYRRILYHRFCTTRDWMSFCIFFRNHNPWIREDICTFHRGCTFPSSISHVVYSTCRPLVYWHTLYHRFYTQRTSSCTHLYAFHNDNPWIPKGIYRLHTWDTFRPSTGSVLPWSCRQTAFQNIFDHRFDTPSVCTHSDFF